MKKVILILNFLFFVGMIINGCSDSKTNEKNAKKSIGKNLKEGNSDEVTIGKQIWMTKNLNVAKFRNGDSITEAKTEKEWQKAGDNKQVAWCLTKMKERKLEMGLLGILKRMFYRTNA